MINTVTLRGKNFKLFERSCPLSCEKVGQTKELPFIDLTVHMTNSCNAACLFCCNEGHNEFIFDVEAFKDFFDDTYKTININKVTFTGGEPTLKIRELNECLDHIEGKCRLITVNTNGTRIDALGHRAIHRIAWSRHHYDDNVNNEIFGVTIGNPIAEPEEDAFCGMNPSIKGKVALVCNLIKGYIDNTDSAYKMLEFAAANGIEDMSFVGLMPCNAWSTEHQVPLDVLKFGKDVLCTRQLHYEVEGVCKCSNYVYTASNGKIVHFYMRHNMIPEYDKGSRVFWKNNQIE